MMRAEQNTIRFHAAAFSALASKACQIIGVHQSRLLKHESVSDEARRIAANIEAAGVVRSEGLAYATACAFRFLRQPSPVAPNIIDLGYDFTGMREAFLNLPQ
jgi:hypothetical protein